MNKLQQTIWILCIAITLMGNAKAEGFSVGAEIGLLNVVDARVTYEAESFGVRAYASLLAVGGIDAYVRLGDPAGLGYRLGAGVWDFWATSGPFFGWRGLLGLAYAFSPELTLAAEIRPMFPIETPRNIAEGALVIYALLVNIGLEYKINL